MNTDMQPIRNAKNHLESLSAELSVLYPGLRSVGSPGFYPDRKRIFTRLVFTDGSKRSVQYARLIYEAHIGRRLTIEETIDHIDGDSSNDSISNLQILSRAENSRKGPNAENLIKGRVKREYINNGLPSPRNRGDLNARAKLTTADVIEIKRHQLNNYRGQDSDLAKLFNVTRTNIKAIRLRETWKHVTPYDNVESVKNNIEELREATKNIRKIRKREISGINERVQKAAELKEIKAAIIKLTNICECGAKVSHRGLMCRKCAAKKSQSKYRKFEATKEELEALIKIYPMTKIGKMFGVSDNAVKNRCRLLGIELRSMRGYWRKVAVGKITIQG